MSEVALCQCLNCHKYLAENRLGDGAWLNNNCTECAGSGGLRLADIRGTLTNPKMLEVLSLISEECAEVIEAADISKAAARVIQRVSKIIRFGWEADFDGTSQQHKLEVELGDLFAAVTLGVLNGLVDLQRIEDHQMNKIKKFVEDANGPRQRLMHAKVTP